MLGMDFSIKRARIFINSLYFIEESVSLSCNGSCFTIKIREFNEDGWTSSVVDGFCIKNGDSINSLVKMDGPGRCSPVGSSSSSSTISKSIQFWNVEGFVYSRVGGGVVNESVLEPSNVLMKEYSLGGCSFYKEGLTEVDLVLGRDKNYDARDRSCSTCWGAAPIYSLDRNGVHSSGNVVGMSERDSVVSRSLGVPYKNFEEACEMVSLKETIISDCEMVPCSKKLSWEVSVDLANGNLEAVDRNEEQSLLFSEL
ncbi:hypothetical protein V6N11_071368 [Hibiscus sabdariffa]|uniref:Uncharacterized protein n=1 Tax=Hibiscus sabdariffa TaxID=183260 RepID=A0ABR2TZX7_9ROSI